MKRTTILIIFFVSLFITKMSFAQETIWFDENWQETTKAKSTYYRPQPKKVKNGYWIVDYYNNGQIQMEGFSTVNEPNNEQFNGLVTYYHKNGNTFHEAHYKNGKLEGIRKVYFKTGELREQGTYKKGKREGIWKTFYKNGKIKNKGKYKNNEKVGIWKTFYKNDF